MLPRLLEYFFQECHIFKIFHVRANQKLIFGLHFPQQVSDAGGEGVGGWILALLLIPDVAIQNHLAHR